MGVCEARLCRAPNSNPYVFLSFFIVLSSCSFMSSFGEPENADSDALLSFKDSLSNTKALSSWKPSVSPCNGNRGNWIGVLCFNGQVRGLQLENMGLKGMLDLNYVASMPHLRTLSIMNNTFTGSMPHLKKLSTLRSVYLSYNHFSGEIPGDAFLGMRFLKKISLNNNEFAGKIPSSLTALPRLTELRLDDNKFQGQIPDFQQPSLRRLNVSNNDLDGPIPTTLSKLDASSFSGNANLCGPPLGFSCISPTNTTTTKNNNNMTAPVKVSGKKSVRNMVLIVIILVLVVVAIAAFFIISHLKTQRRGLQLLGNDKVCNTSSTLTVNDRSNKYATSTSLMEPPKLKLADAHATPKRVEQAGKLSFVWNDRAKFDLHDLLRASAEILGSGTFGASYKASILSDDVVVKRYKQMNNVGREDFQEHMRRLGSLTHQNLLPLVAYYYRKEEKLLVSDFVDNGSLAFHLHGNHNIEEPGLDWPSRLRIIKGVGRGLTYLYSALPSLVVPHGHLKSSNVLLDDSLEPLLNDYALIPVINQEHAQHLMMAYKSPEYAKLGRITKKTDVWSFGILILEMLTGKFPENYLTHRYDPNADLATWVNDMIKQKRTSEVFDVEMEGARNCKEELVKLLKIGLSCCEEDLDARLDLNQVIHKIDQLNYDGDYFSD
ncbi:hypothetical protein FNV43_RR27056 [Rhamnella rubrinervis]|uniref:non-specific serine/threonine protein kinase n=1 Tax=Rhamnella rubrinervis TaxID=2594499 RepID=A0A8K0DP83_9ROSA|nr:hypothetical protein FNV43_RR27056 [Rhamnella rubrinervis]